MLAPLLVSLVLATAQNEPKPAQTLNTKDTGYRGIWYMNQPLDNEYRFKYSGGQATYCAKHQPFAVYCEKVNKTFFCYGGTTEPGPQAFNPGGEVAMWTSTDQNAAGRLRPRRSACAQERARCSACRRT